MKNYTPFVFENYILFRFPRLNQETEVNIKFQCREIVRCIMAYPLQPLRVMIMKMHIPWENIMIF